jgi:hypothetical protein
VKKIYSHKQIVIATFLGGPVATGHMLWRNFKIMGEPKRGAFWFFMSIAFTVLVLGLFYIIPDVEKKVPKHFVPIAYTIIAHFIILKVQSKKIDEYLHNRGELFGWWRTLVVMLLAAIITVGPLFAAEYFYEETTEIKSAAKHYGNLNHEIGYEPENISAAEVDHVAAVLDSVGFFGNEMREYIYLKKNSSGYELFIPLIRGESISDQESFFRPLHKNMQEFFPENKIMINLVDGSIENILVRIEP